MSKQTDYLKKKWEQISKSPVTNEETISLGNGKFEVKDILALPSSILKGFIDSISAAIGTFVSSIRGIFNTAIKLVKSMFGKE